MVPECHRATETVTASGTINPLIKQTVAFVYKMLVILIERHYLFAKGTDAIMIIFIKVV